MEINVVYEIALKKVWIYE